MYLQTNLRTHPIFPRLVNMVVCMLRPVLSCSSFILMMWTAFRVLMVRQASQFILTSAQIRFSLLSHCSLKHSLSFDCVTISHTNIRDTSRSNSESLVPLVCYNIFTLKGGSHAWGNIHADSSGCSWMTEKLVFAGCARHII